MTQLASLAPDTDAESLRNLERDINLLLSAGDALAEVSLYTTTPTELDAHRTKWHLYRARLDASLDALNTRTPQH
jgi:hypothetical protein